jgi:ribose-phosphate pyrophosphokinase
MTGAAVHAFADQEGPARRLADAMGLPFLPIVRHRFPDGESLVRVVPQPGRAVLYCALDRPNDRLVDLLLAASALRDGGAGPVELVAPYLGYMRQDIAFHPGEAISQRVIGRLLSAAVDRVVTVDPHLHRTADLGAVFAVPAVHASAAPLLGRAIAAAYPAGTVLVGPDAESRPWVAAAAQAAGLPFLVGRKVRHGDRAVEIQIDGSAMVQGRAVVLVDDLVSSGVTACRAAALLRAAGAHSVDIHATHVLSTEGDLAAMHAAGIGRIVSTDSVAHASNAIPLAGLLAGLLAGKAG